ncbi:MAG: hypothetical protein KF858_10810 [Candidatus Sumerlaeia bacterium]|nr:hypothetical protein [Candidatus Sumerlaeia bacterium]
MKWVCLVILIIDLLLFGFAGFTYFTAPNRDVEAMSKRIDAKIRGAQAPAPARRTPPPRETAPAPTGENSADAGTTTSRAYVTEQQPVMNIEAFGISRESAKLKAIEDGRNLVNDEGAKALAED